ncbi:MAG: ricin-type beta-trefoil lectin domain protein, partial [Dermatophilaceae bacterium]
TVTLEGATWDVWIGNVGWNVISYVRQQPTDSMSNFSVSNFVDDAVSRGQVDKDWYMTSVQAGFEPWVGGTGLGVRDFSFTTAGNGGSGGGEPTPDSGGEPTPDSSGEPTPDSSGEPTPDSGGGMGTPPDSGTDNDNDDKKSTRNGVRTRTGTVVGRGSGRCLDAAGTTPRTPIQLWNCGTDNPRQGWARDGSALVNTGSGLCLDVQGASTDNGARVQLWECHGGAAQRWERRADGALINPKSGKCLDAGGSGDGAPLQIWECDGRGAAPNQQWTVR